MNKISSYLIRKKPNLFLFFFSLKRMVFFWGWLQKRWCQPVLFDVFEAVKFSRGAEDSCLPFPSRGGERDGKCLNSWWGFCVCVFWGVVGGLRNHCGNATLSTGITEIVLQVGFMSKSISPSKHKHTHVSHACTEVNDQPEISLPSSFCCKD